MAECLNKMDELGKEGLLQGRVHKPNLMRVAIEIGSYENSHKTAHTLLRLLESSAEDSANGDQDIGLLFSNIAVSINESK